MNGNLLEDKSQRTFFWSKSKHVRWLKSFQCQFWMVNMCEHVWISTFSWLKPDSNHSNHSNHRSLIFDLKHPCFLLPRSRLSAFSKSVRPTPPSPLRPTWDEFQPPVAGYHGETIGGNHEGLCKAYLGGYIINIINNIYYISIIYIYTLYIHYIYIYIYIIATKDGFIWYSTSRLGTWNGNWKMDCLSLKDLKGYISPNKIGISHTNLEGFAYIVPCWNGTGDQSGKFTAFWQQTLTAKLHPPLSCCDAI